MHTNEHGNYNKIITSYSSITSVRNSVIADVDVDGWNPSESDVDKIMLSKSSKTMREGAWSKASDI